jgi:hypothetical protein
MPINVHTEKGHDPIPYHGTFLVDTTTVRIPITRNDPNRQRINSLFKIASKIGFQDLSIDTSLHQGVLVVDLKHAQPPSTIPPIWWE